MARSPLGFGAVTCAACGAKIRGDRVRCLRCGEALAALAAEQPRPAAPRTRLFAAAAALGAAALIGVVVLQPRQTAATSIAPPPQPAAQHTADAPAAGAEAAAPPQVRAGAATARDVYAGARVAYTSGDVGTAVQRFKDAVDLDPGNSDALNNLGQVLVRDGRAEEAIAYFDRAIAIAPNTWAYRFNRARACGLLEQWDRAVAGYRDALKIFPDDYATHFNLAKALQKLGDLPAAIGAFERSIQLAPGEPNFHLSHGLALEAAQRPKDAANAYRRYLELAEAGPEADKVKGRIALLDGPAAGAPRSEQP